MTTVCPSLIARMVTWSGGGRLGSGTSYFGGCGEKVEEFWWILDETKRSSISVFFFCSSIGLLLALKAVVLGSYVLQSEIQDLDGDPLH